MSVLHCLFDGEFTISRCQFFKSICLVSKVNMIFFFYASKALEGIKRQLYDLLHTSFNATVSLWTAHLIIFKKLYILSSFILILRYSNLLLICLSLLIFSFKSPTATKPVGLQLNHKYIQNKINLITENTLKL